MAHLSLEEQEEYKKLKSRIEELENRPTIYGYAWVSTTAQAKDGNSLEAQSLALNNAGADEIYSDDYTGTKTSRPVFDELIKKIKSGDTITVTKLDRIARNLVQGIELIDSLNKRGIKVNVLNMGLIDDTPTGRFIRNIMLAIAEWERDMIIQRTQEGKEIAKQKPGFHEGRPKKFTKAQEKHALELLKDHSYKEVTDMTGISRATLGRIKHNAKIVLR